MKTARLAGVGTAIALCVPATARAYTLFDLGTVGIGSATLLANQGTAPGTDAAATTAATRFDLRGTFDVSPGFQAGAYKSLVQAGGTLTNVSAAIYARDPSGAPGALVARVPATFSNANSWLFQSPVSFSLAPGKYLFQISGDKQPGRVLEYQLAVTAVPLPPAVLMFGAGLVVVGALAWRRRRPTGQAA